jgi:hypothetical protein
MKLELGVAPNSLFHERHMQVPSNIRGLRTTPAVSVSELIPGLAVDNARAFRRLLGSLALREAKGLPIGLIPEKELDAIKLTIAGFRKVGGADLAKAEELVGKFNSNVEYKDLLKNQTEPSPGFGIDDVRRFKTALASLRSKDPSSGPIPTKDLQAIAVFRQRFQADLVRADNLLKP